MKPTPPSYVVLVAVAILATVLVASLARRLDRKALGLVALALGIELSIWWAWPLERHEFVGQSDMSRRLALGFEPLGRQWPWYLHPPGMRLLAWLVGTTGLEVQRTLLAVAAVASAGWTASLALIASRLGGSIWAGIFVLVLLAFDPQRLAWGHAAYHVIHPAALLGLAAALLLATGDGAGRAQVAAGLLAALAVSLRLEMLVFLPVLGCLVWSAEPRRGALVRTLLVPSAICGGVLIALRLTQVPGIEFIEYGWAPEVALRSLATAIDFLGFLDGWTSPGSIMILAAVVAGSLARPAEAARGPLVALLASLLGAWLILASYTDAGARQFLPLRGFLPVGIALAAKRWPRPGLVMGVAAIVLLPSLVLEARAMRSEWFSEGRLDHGAVDLQYISEAELLGGLGRECGLVTNERDGLVGMLPRNHVWHLELLDPQTAAAVWQQHRGCLLWLVDPSDRRWDESARRIRRDRLEHAWEWETLGMALGRRGMVFEVRRLQRGADGGPQPRAKVLRALWEAVPEVLGVGPLQTTCLLGGRTACHWGGRCQYLDALGVEVCYRETAIACVQGAPITTLEDRQACAELNDMPCLGGPIVERQQACGRLGP
jgi:hypothetical protein